MPISNIQTDETYTPMKKYLFLTLLAAAFLAGGGCSSSDDDGWGVIELASPKLKVTTELATATVTWDAVAKTAGYAYALDGAADYTSVDAATTTVTLTALAEGGHTFRLKAVGDLDHTTDSAERTIDFEIDPTLPQPAPTYVKGDEIGSVVVSWPAVKGAAGYAYKFGEAASFTEVGADVLSVTQKGLSAEEPIRFTMYAVGQLPDSKDSEPVSLTFQLVDTSEGVWVRKSNGELFELTESEAKIYTGTVSVSAADSFEILVENVPYGFLSYSGNGGVGTVNNDRACVPFYTYPAAEYYVRRSLGRMASDPLNKFWINLTADARIDLRIDCTQDPFRYDLQLVEADDPALILAQYFDLMVYGGDWIQAGKNAKSGRMGQSTDTALIDGTEPGEKEASYTTFGAKIASEGEASPAYLANRGLTGWGIAHCFEFPGYIRLSNTANSSGNMYGILTTPKLTALSGPTSITLTFDAVRFASTSDIPVKVLGAGTIKTASVRIEEGTAETAITPAADGQSIAITSTHCPKHANDDFKKWSCFTLTIDGATAETQIRWDTTGVGAESKDGRICLDNLAIRKN